MIHHVQQHAKFKRLVRRLRPLLDGAAVAPETTAIGLLERLWHATIVNAFRGDIGRLDNEDIAELLGWHGDADELVAILAECRWLDELDGCRLYVHDWHDHAPKFVVGNVKKSWLAGGPAWGNGFIPDRWLQEHPRAGNADAENSPKEGSPKETPREDPPQADDVLNLTRPNSTRPNPTRSKWSTSTKDTDDGEDASASPSLVDRDPERIAPPDLEAVRRFGPKIGPPSSRSDQVLAYKLVALASVLGEAWLANIAEGVLRTAPKTPWAYAWTLAANGSTELPGPGETRLRKLLARVADPPADWPSKSGPDLSRRLCVVGADEEGFEPL